MDYGSDFSGTEDIDALWSFYETTTQKITALTQAIARRFVTPRGGLFYDQSYGLDLRSFVSDTAEPASVEAMIAAEARKDDRVDDCKASIVATGGLGNQSWNVQINCISNSGEPFALTLAVSAVSVSLITAGP